MHPEIREPRADARLGLRDLVRVMDGDVILAAAMDVEEVAQGVQPLRGRLDMDDAVVGMRVQPVVATRRLTNGPWAVWVTAGVTMPIPYGIDSGAPFTNTSRWTWMW